ncbi:MAG: hypothetical protein AB7I27_18350 [Bacteriovoracaceae bacterium]
MLKAGSMTLAVLMTLSSFTYANVDQQRDQVETLKELSRKIPGIDIKGFEREIDYEAKGLSHEERASQETNLVAEKIRVQILKSYEVALKESGDAEAAAQVVRQAYQKDLKLVDPSLRAEIQMLSEEALEAAQHGASSSAVSLHNLERAMLDTVKARNEVLSVDTPKPQSDIERQNSIFNDKHRDYADREEFVQALVDGKELSARWVSTSNTTFDSKIIRKRETEVVVQMGIDFMGAKFSAGPKIKFRREYTSRARIMAEGMHTVIHPDGNLDFYKRDENGSVIVKNGVKQKRFIAYSCEVELRYETEAIAEGGFQIGGVGVSQEETRIFNEQSEKVSRRILVPEAIGDKTVTVELLREICHKDYLKAKIDNKHTVDDVLNEDVKNLVATVHLSHPKFKCVEDSHCQKWFRNEIAPIFRTRTYPRCDQDRGICLLKGLEKQRCSIYNKQGKRITNGFEFKCDDGLKCVQVKKGGWFTDGSIYQAPVGRCMPASASYVSPIPALRR